MFRKLLSLLFVFSLITFIVSVFAKDFGSIIQKTDTALYAGDWQVVYDSGELSSAQTSITISNLDGDTDQEYELICRFIGGASADVKLRPNNDSGTNYGYQYMQGDLVTPSAGRSTSNGIYIGSNLMNNNINFSRTMLYAKSGYVRTSITENAYNISGTTVTGIQKWGQSWNNTTDNITSLVITGGTNGIGVGSRIILLERSPSVSGSGEWQLV